MTPAGAGGLLTGAIALGAVLVVAGWLGTRRPALYDRVAPYVRDVAPPAVSDPGRLTWSDQARRLVTAVADVIGGPADVQRRLDRLGSALRLEDFRLRQLRWAGAGAAAAIALSLLVAARRPVQPVALLVFCLAVTVVAAWWCDHDLTRRVVERERSMEQEFPTVADMLALAVAAGESPAAAVQRVATISHGELAEELRRVMGDVHTGGTVAEAFDALASRTGVGSIARFAEALAGAVERGTPLIDVLHAQSADVRESARRSLIESGGRREVLMMVPVVFAILPVTIVFAFFPGLVGLHLTS
ncbi:type II secretion system F family protein [Aeromicrobium sp. Leaf350]|uniref:type II secretion system F family protein n=1 Tax=Aeromicrobium sp. Leaf350 TaxID=2876565 RepID=UPI001E324E8A|nr:type II secretion system F family protein [Aeromicrobium sp. Leaf350]